MTHGVLVDSQAKESLFSSAQTRPRRPSYGRSMPRQFCDTCGREGRWLEDAAKTTRMDYYRCAEGHVWRIPTSNPRAAQTRVSAQDAPQPPR